MAATAFAHISDPHLPLGLGVPRPLRLLAGKRLLGYLSWRLGRHRHHTGAALWALCQDIAAHAPDHLLITGDLVNIALPEEFAAARAWLESLGIPDRVSVAPGNHDLTVPMPWHAGIGLWEPWMTGDDGGSVDPAGDRFPFIRIRGHVAFVTLSSAVATPPLMASGRLGRAQIERTEAALAALGRAGLFRVVGIHHPPLDGIISARKALRDRGDFRDMLAATGAELVVFGHCHRSHLGHVSGPLGPIPVVGVPSASASGKVVDGRDGDGPAGRHQRHARWHLFRVSRTPGAWSLSLTVRGLRGDGICATEGGWTVTLPACRTGGDTGITAPFP